MIDRGALMSRYSRATDLDIRDVYEREFAANPDRGKDFYRRVFTEYGDESIAELVTAQIGIQNLSNVATKVIEESRIGLSYLEKSSRYVNYDVRKNGEYLFLHPDAAGIGGNIASSYESYCNELFEGYAELKKELEGRMRERYPLESTISDDIMDSRLIDSGDSDLVLKKSYDRSLKSRVFDEVRNLLPASTLTNMGISGNGRAYLGMILRLRQHAIPELRSIAESVFNELQMELPELIDTANTDYSRKTVDYNVMRDSTPELKGDVSAGPVVSLLSHDNEEEAMKKVFRAREYLGCTDCVSDSSSYEANLPEYEKILEAEISIRQNRRHKPGRWYEFTNFTFEVNTNFGSFRDLQRHRMMTIIRKKISPVFGFDVPPELGRYPELRQKYEHLMHKGREVWKVIKDAYGEGIAQYAVPYGYRYPVLVGANLRELCYFIELRSTPQAHYDLRYISQEMYRLIQRAHPRLSGIIKFTDMNEYVFGRMKSEVRKEEKLRRLNSERS